MVSEDCYLVISCPDLRRVARRYELVGEHEDRRPARQHASRRSPDLVQYRTSSSRLQSEALGDSKEGSYIVIFFVLFFYFSVV